MNEFQFKSCQPLKLDDIQNQIDTWINSTGVRYFNELTNTAILMEEVGEVARIMSRKFGEQSFKKHESDIDLGEELADVLFVLVALANQTGYNLTDMYQQGMLKRNQRDKYRHKKNSKLTE